MEYATSGSFAKCEYRTLFDIAAGRARTCQRSSPFGLERILPDFAFANARELCVPPITQDQLSGRLAAFGVTVDRTALTKIEKGVRGIYDYELAAFALALRVDANWLLGITPKRTL